MERIYTDIFPCLQIIRCANLEKQPFLVVIFDLSQAYFDRDRNGITDKVSPFTGKIDPADFYMIMPDAGNYCSDPRLPGVEGGDASRLGI
jgi:hypothetical protein